MFSKKFLGFTLALLLAFGFYGAIAKADVTGSFGVNLGFNPIDCRFLTLVNPDDLSLLGFSDQPCEQTVYKFDIQTSLDVNVTVSGLTMGIHSHAGTTGFEDIILTFATTLGALDITDTFVFAQPFAQLPLGVDGNNDGDLGDWRDGTDYIEQIITVCLVDPGDDPTTVLDDTCPTLFVKKRVDASISLGGVTFSNLAMLEDVNFPNWCIDFFYAFGPIVGITPAGPQSLVDLVGCAYHPFKGDTNVQWTIAGVPMAGDGFILPPFEVPETYSAQSQAFGFGDVVSVEGQTPSGITVRAETGICAEQLTNGIKKHNWEYRVNADCYSGAAATGVKPPLVFSFEKLFIEGVPLAAGLTMDVSVQCGSLAGSADPLGSLGSPTFYPCSIFPRLVITGGPLFNSIEVQAGIVDILGPSAFTDIEVVAAGGPLLFIVDFSPLDWSVTFIYAQANFTINPDTNPASLRLRAIGEPDIYFFDARLSISRAGLDFFADLDLDVNSVDESFDFDDLTFGLSAEAGIVTIEANVVVKEANYYHVLPGPTTAFLLGGDLSFTVNF